MRLYAGNVTLNHTQGFAAVALLPHFVQLAEHSRKRSHGSALLEGQAHSSSSAKEGDCFVGLAATLIVKDQVVLFRLEH